MSISAWVVCGPSMTNAYDNRFAAENADPPEDYNGPMDDQSYAIMSTVVDITKVRPQYKTKQVSGQSPFTLFSMNFTDEQETTDSLVYLDAQWPGQQIEIQGAWDTETGYQMGLVIEFDDDGNVIAVSGTPTYPLNDTAYELMPDVVEYDEEGNEISREPATSNLELRDVNVVFGQVPRKFNGQVEVASIFDQKRQKTTR